MARTTIQLRVRPEIRSTTGIAATASPEKTSEPTAVRLRPTRSTRVPAKTLETNSGSKAAADTRPAAPALPVCSITSHGRATIITPLPTAEIKVLDSSRRIGPRFPPADIGTPFRDHPTET